MRIGITGHQWIPIRAQSFVATHVERIVREVAGNLVGVSSLAAGADQVFADIVLKSRGELYVVVPCVDYESTFRDESSLVGYRRLLTLAVNVERLSYRCPSEDAFLDAGRRVADLAELLVAVWDGDEARGKGGTADIVEYARNRRTKVVVVWPEGVTR
ncbi:MAG: hypothetical protein OXT64_04875 [Gammaproteobacteria bacterium]|nr:hypothetical protein [Gammaproteobacteria bacterium]